MPAPGHLPAVTDGAETHQEQSTDELINDAQAAFGEIFSVRAPRDVLAGIWSGVQCIASGMVLSVAGLIMQPIEGMRDSGVPGCFRGVALGLCTGIFFSVTGLCTGLFQAVRGVVATPRALCMASKGWRWDADVGRWEAPEEYSLPEEAAEVLAGGADEEEEDDFSPGSSSSSSKKRVADSFYYDQLQVAPTASQREIRAAYFQQSRQWHPDKTDNPQAKARFQSISEAYQVLSDPVRRRAYDAQGREGVKEGFVDAQIFFSVLFGADALGDHIGRLQLADVFGKELFSVDSNSTEATSTDLNEHSREAARKKLRQVRRQVRLALGLVDRLQPYVEGKCEDFIREAHEEARGILQKDLSLERFIFEIGWVYQNHAEWHLARHSSRFGSFGLQALRLRLRRRGREAQQQAKIAKLAIKSFLQLRKIVNEADANSTEASNSDATHADEGSTPESPNEERMPSSINNALPTFMETFWSFTAHEISDTLNKVIERILGDTSVPMSERMQRAQGLRELGAAFVSEAEVVRANALAGSEADDEQKVRRFEEAFMASVSAGARSSDQ